jgi:hypothetical protein
VAAVDEASTKGEKGVGLAPYVVGGVGVAGVAGFALMYAIARNDNKALTRCWPTCAQSQVNAVNLDYIAADISLGVGIAALGTAAAWLYFGSQSPGKEPAPAPHYAIDVRPSSTGMFATVSGAF